PLIDPAAFDLPQHGAWYIAKKGVWHCPLPYLMHGAAFAINTVCYAAVLWGLWLVPGLVRRRIRLRRGLCAKCGYDLRASTTGICPECGKPLRDSRKAEPSL